MPGTLLSKAYPSAHDWRELVQSFSADAIAHKLLLAHVPYIFRDEPLKFALFRRTIADAFGVEPSNVFIVGSAMAGRSLKGDAIEKSYSTDSDIDTLIISEHLFARYVMESLEWVRDVTKPFYEHSKLKSPSIPPETTKNLHWLAMHACKGIWRPDSLPPDAPTRIRFFDTFSDVSLKVLGLQLSEDTVAKVNGRIARSFDDAAKDLAQSIYRLRKEFDRQAPATPQSGSGEELPDDSVEETAT